MNIHKIWLMMRIILFLGIFLILLLVTSYIFTPKTNAKDYAIKEVNANGILGEKENTIDVVVLGDSEAYRAISPMEIWKEQGIPTYVCATSGQRLFEAYDLLNQVVEVQDVKVVFLETDEIYRECKDEQYLMSKGKSIFAVLKYHNRWKTIKLNDFYDKIEYTCTDDKKGFIYCKDIIPASTKNYMAPSDTVKTIPELNRKCFDDIVSVCDENDIKLILLSTPSTKNWNYERHNGIQALSDEYELTYIDMNLLQDDVKIDWEKDTRDKGDHMNYYGAVKVSSYLGKYLKNEFNLKDQRDNNEYADWNEACERYYTNIVK